MQSSNASQSTDYQNKYSSIEEFRNSVGFTTTLIFWKKYQILTDKQAQTDWSVELLRNKNLC